MIKIKQEIICHNGKCIETMEIMVKNLENEYLSKEDIMLYLANLE